MDYYATYTRDEPLPVGAAPGGASAEDVDTLIYDVKIFAHDLGGLDDEALDPPDARPYIARLRFRRAMISKVYNSGRSVPEAMDVIDQLQWDIFQAVWDFQTDEYKLEETAIAGDLKIFEPMILRSTFLPDFDINRILDDINHHVGGTDGLVVFTEEYADFVHFNADRCQHIEGVGYVRSDWWGLLAKRYEESA